MRASVVMPVRNAATTLADAVASCLSQDLPDIEIILILNGCTDETPRIAETLARRDARIVLLESPSDGGLVTALNTGWQAARSEIIIRMDADDLSHPARVRTQVELLENRPDLSAATCGVQLIDALGDGMKRHVEWANSLLDEDDISRGRFIECPVIHPSAAIRRGALESLGGYQNPPWAEDHDLWLRLLERGEKIGKVPAVLLDWRDHASRLTRTDPRYAIDQVWRMKAHYLAKLPQARTHGIALAGAGPIGKTLAKHLHSEGATVHGFFDVSPKRIGGTAAGLPVRASSEIGSTWREAILVSTVGIPGGRDLVRAVAIAAGYTEGGDFWCGC